MSEMPSTSGRRSLKTYVLGLAPVIFVWLALAIWLAVLILDRSTFSQTTDVATLREWLDETRNFRKTLPELIREAVRISDDEGDDSDRYRLKIEEVQTHVRALTEPLRIYPNQLPMFPEVYRLEIRIVGKSRPVMIDYDSGTPRPRGQDRNLVRTFEYEPLGNGNHRASIRCDFRVHALNKLQQREDDRQSRAFLAEAVLAAATILAGLFVFRFLRRERIIETQRLEALAAAEHRERELAEAKLLQEEVEREKEKLDRELLRKQLDAREFEARAAAAEAAAAEMKTHFYANIGIMAGSYAHNIKNLLVRPNDLLARSLEADGISGQQSEMLHEVQKTLGIVTDRLQQILATVRRDPTSTMLDHIDLNRFARDSVETWADLSREKWKVNLTCETSPEPLFIRGDASNLQQVIENLIFNARDATFEMRNHLRNEARATPGLDANARRDRLLAAAAWRGEIRVTTRSDGDRAILEIRDTGIGMSPDVKAKCLDTHFSTKRDNALYEGHAAGMGLGLSFVAVVLERHEAKLDIDSTPNAGATFRVSFALDTETPVNGTPAHS
ncbi:MAG: sensor histidine kinase [Gemmataceae bacterium]